MADVGHKKREFNTQWLLPDDIAPLSNDFYAYIRRRTIRRYELWHPAFQFALTPQDNILFAIIATKFIINILYFLWVKKKSRQK